MDATTNTSTFPPKYYRQFGVIYAYMMKISLPYVFLVATIGLVTNTTTVIFLSKNSITKNLKNRWALIALGKSFLSMFRPSVWPTRENE